LKGDFHVARLVRRRALLLVHRVVQEVRLIAALIRAPPPATSLPQPRGFATNRPETSTWQRLSEHTIKANRASLERCKAPAKYRIILWPRRTHLRQEALALPTLPFILCGDTDAGASVSKHSANHLLV
jgi:hypothetical protein